MIVVDSSIWIDFFTGKDTPGVEVLDASLGEDVVAIGDLMLTEVLQGFRSDPDFRKARQLLLSLTIFNVVSTDIALKSAANYRELRALGITVRKTVDTIIATFCIGEKLPLLHSDRDFEPFHVHLGLKNALD